MSSMPQRIESALRCAGRPMTRAEIRAALGLSPLDWTPFYALQGRLPFVEVDGCRWGLVDRDVPGGMDAFHRAVGTVWLSSCRLPSAATKAVRGLGGVFEGWTTEMTLSAYRVVKAGGALDLGAPVARLEPSYSAAAAAG